MTANIPKHRKHLIKKHFASKVDAPSFNEIKNNMKIRKCIKDFLKKMIPGKYHFYFKVIHLYLNNIAKYGGIRFKCVCCGVVFMLTLVKKG